MPIPNPFPLNISEKINSPELLAFFQQFGIEHYLSAEEINELVLGMQYIYEVGSGGLIPDAAPATKGIAKLYAALGTNIDGSIDQKTITEKFYEKVSLEQVIVSTDTTALESWKGKVILITNNLTLTIPVTLSKDWGIRIIVVSGKLHLKKNVAQTWGITPFPPALIDKESDFHIRKKGVTNEIIVSGKILSTPFVSTFDTRDTSVGSSASNQITIPFVSTNFDNVYVDWGDGNIDFIPTWNSLLNTHTYSISGLKTIKIYANNFSFVFNAGDKLKIKDISSWGSITLIGSFEGCEYLTLDKVLDVPKIGTSLASCFSNCFSLTSINRSNEWDTSNATQMQNMFQYSSSFDSPIGSWNTTNVTNMEVMFSFASKFNQPIENWDTSNVTSMGGMFNNCSKFNQPIGNWDTSKVTNMTAMFTFMQFNQPIGSWNTSKVTNMTAMFNGNSTFNQDISNWNVSLVTGMNLMFKGSTAFNQDISDWNVVKLLSAVEFMKLKLPANYSSANLNSIYNKWSLLTLKPNVTIDFGTIKYTAGGSAGKAVLQGSPNNWTILDGGI